MYKVKCLYGKYFPTLGFLLCIIGEILFQVLPLLAFMKGILIFYVWPVSLLAWLIHYPRKQPEIKISNYYLFMVLLFTAFALAVITPLVFNLSGFSKDTRQKISENLGYILIGLYLVLAVYQVWAIRRGNKIKEKTEASDQAPRNINEA
jgi:Ca2+/Na+ antiporter